MTDSVVTDISLRGGGKNRRRSWPRRARLVTASAVALLCLIWFVPWAYVRMTTPPARAHDDYSDLFAHFYSSDDDDATAEWMTALAAIPRWPTFDEPPPTGTKWKFEYGTAPAIIITDMNAGRWDPVSRPILRVMIRYVSSPQMSSALERIGGLHDRPFTFDINLGQMPDAPPKVSFSEIRLLAKILCARSRFRSETGRDAGGWSDLKTVLMICRTAPQDTLIARLVLTATEALALNELRRYLRETTIDEALARDMDRMLDSLSTPAQAWREAMSGERYFGLHEIDSCFSDDGNGNGWLVLGVQPDFRTAWTVAGPAPASKRSELWNLLSPLYHNRRTVTKRLEDRVAHRVAASDRPYNDSIAWLRAVDWQYAYESSDGPWLHFIRQTDKVYRAYQLTVRQFATREATRIMAALSWYKSERGHYPPRLEELVPGYISSLPVDPFCDDSFGYQRVGDANYVLFSCGIDGDDDHGKPGKGFTGRPRAFADEGDDIYTFPRSDGVSKEPVAVPIGASDGAQP